jgi:ESF2/ABP1 family protein
MSSAEDDDTPLAGEGAGGSEDDEPAAPSAGKRVLTARKLEKLQARAAKKGVVYLSRVPPFMKPVKLRHLLEQHGEVLRIYLAAEGAWSGREAAPHSCEALRKAVRRR